MNEEISDNRKDKLLKYPDKYLHKTEVSYPRKNVENFMKSWTEEVEKRQEIVDNFEDVVEHSIQTALDKMDEDLVVIKKTIESDLSKEAEELKDELYKQRMDEIKEQQKFIEAADNKKEELKKRVREQLEQNKLNHEKKIKEKKEALKFWRNPKTK